ncbi:MAG: ASPIC/UnbV domain-containing protein [Planctomycetes bacterium]|nr:ASPIC/UnbV domain-containing protein [Planctomycetota bacterium]
MPGNPTAVGARVTVRRSNGQQQTAEVYAGAGYLSQSAPVLFFGRDADSGEVDVTIRWPDATDSTHRVEGADNYVVLAHPDYEP